MKITFPEDSKDLMEWFLPWIQRHDGSVLIYKDSASEQIQFIRDAIAPMVLSGTSYYENLIEISDAKGGKREVCRSSLVVGEHTSKSVVLPVYAFERPDLGLQLVMRCNFYNWKLSVLSEQRIEAPFEALFHTIPPPDPGYTGNDLAPVYFEGFQKDWCFNYYSLNHRKWSCQLNDKSSLWTVVFLIMSSLGALPTLTYSTRKEHRAKLDGYREEGRKHQERIEAADNKSNTEQEPE